MTRRTKGEGSITQLKDGRWQSRITISTPEGKKRRALYGRTAAEARRLMTAALKRSDDNLPLPRGDLTVAGHLMSWLEHKRGGLRPETWRPYNDYCERWLIPVIGKRKLEKLSVQDVQDMQKTLADQGLSATSRQHAHGVLRTSLQDAVRWDRVGRNVASLVTAPRRSTAEMRFLGPDDARDLLQAAQGSDLEGLFVVALTTGLREGELQALKWTNVDFGRRRLRVVSTLLTIMDGRPVYGEPKTQHSRRTVWLSEKTAEALEKQRVNQEAVRRLAGPAWTENGLVFTNALGQPLWRSQVWRAFKGLLKKAGLADMRVHDLRHTAATLLLAEGVPIKVASELLGHSDVQTTLRIYAHVIEGAQEQAASAMDRLFHA